MCAVSTGGRQGGRPEAGLLRLSICLLFQQEEDKEAVLRLASYACLDLCLLSGKDLVAMDKGGNFRREVWWPIGTVGASDGQGVMNLTTDTKPGFESGGHPYKREYTVPRMDAHPFSIKPAPSSPLKISVGVALNPLFF